MNKGNKNLFKILAIVIGVIAVGVIALIISKSEACGPAEEIYSYEYFIDNVDSNDNSITVWKGYERPFTPIVNKLDSEGNIVEEDIISNFKITTPDGLIYENNLLKCTDKPSEDAVILIHPRTEEVIPDFQIKVKYIEELIEFRNVTNSNLNIEINSETIFNFDIQPVEVDLEKYVTYSLSYVDDDTIIPSTQYVNFVEVYYGKNTMTFKLLGVGKLEIDLLINYSNINLVKSFIVESYFEDNVINDAVLLDSEYSYVSKTDLEKKETLILNFNQDESESINNNNSAEIEGGSETQKEELNVSFKGTEALENLKTIIYNTDLFVNIVSDHYPNCDYRIKIKEQADDQLLLKYLSSEKYSELKNQIIPFMNNYTDKFVVYHHFEDEENINKFKPNTDVYGTYVYCEKLTSSSKFISHQNETTYKVYGYNFDSWLSSSGTKVDINKFMSSKNGMHLYATWKALTIKLELIDHINNDRTYEVTFDSAFGEITYQPQINGFTFVGWYLDDESSDFKYTEDKLIVKDEISDLTKNHKAYAKYTTTIVVDTYGNAETFEINNVIYGEKIGDELKNPTEIVNNKWSFEGWFDTKYGVGENIEQLTSDTNFVGQGSIVDNKFEIYAKWTKDVNLSFYNDAKYNNPLTWESSVNITYGVSLSTINHLLPEPFEIGEANSELKNWNFEGWYQEQEFITSFNNTKLVESFEFADTLFAKFTTNYYLGLYNDVSDYTSDLLNSDNPLEKCMPTYESSVTFGEMVNVRDHKILVGCEFVDWTLNENKINKSITFNDFNLGEITLYPAFEIINFNIYYGYRANNTYNKVNFSQTFNVFDLRFEKVTENDVNNSDLINKIESSIDPGKKVVGFNYYIDDTFTESKLRTNEDINRNYVNIYADAVIDNRTFNVIYYNYSFEQNEWVPIEVDEQYCKVVYTKRFNISPSIVLDGWGGSNGWYNNNGNFGVDSQGTLHTNSLLFDETYCKNYGYSDVHLYPKYDMDIIFNSVILGNSGSEVNETINVTFGSKVDVPLQKIKDICSNATQNSNPWEFLYWTKEISSDFSNLETFDNMNFECFKTRTNTFDIENGNKGYLNLYAVWAKKFILEYYQNETEQNKKVFEYENEIINEVQLYYSYTNKIVDILNSVKLKNSDWNIVSWYNGSANGISLLEDSNHLMLKNSDSNVIKAIFEKKININSKSVLAIGYENEIQASRNDLKNDKVQNYDYTIGNVEFIIRLDSNFSTIVGLNNVSLEKYLEDNKNSIDNFVLEGLYCDSNEKYYKFNDNKFSNNYIIGIDFKDTKEFKLVYKAIPYNITYYEEEGISSDPYEQGKYSIIDPINVPLCPEKENYAFYTEKWVYYDAATNEVLENQDINEVQKLYKDLYAIATYVPVSYKVYIMNNNGDELHELLGLDEVLSYSFKEKYYYTETGLTGLDYFKKIYKDTLIDLTKEQKDLFYEQLYITGKNFEWKCYDYKTSKEISLEATGKYEGDVVFKPVYKPINYNIQFVDAFDSTNEKLISIDGNTSWTYNVETGYSTRIPSGSEVSKDYYTFNWMIFWGENEYLLDLNNRLTSDFIDECFMENNISSYNDEIITIKAIYTPVEYSIKYVNEFFDETDDSLDNQFDKLIGIVEYNVTTISDIKPLIVPFKIRDTGEVDDGSWFSGAWQYFNENGEEVFIDENLHGNIIAKPVYTANVYKVTFKFVDSILNKTAELGTKEFTMPARNEFTGDDILEANKEEYRLLGYDLVGWLEYELIAENMFIYADYDYIEYTVSYLYEDGVTKVQYLDLTTGQATDYTSTHTILQYSSDLSYPELPYKEGYNIKWRCEVDGVEVSGTSRLAPCEVTCVVSYELIPYKVTFRVNEDIYYVSVYYINDLKKVTPYNDPELDGYVFDGWYIDNKEFNINWSDYELTSGDINVIAKFNPIIYTITYQFDDETTEVIEYSNDGLNGLTVPQVPNKSGMTGVWVYYDESDNIVTKIEGGNLIAKLSYSLNSYEIKYMIEEEVVKTLLYSVETDMNGLDIPELENELTWVYYNELGEVVELVNGLTSNLIARPSNEEAVYYVNYYDSVDKEKIIATLNYGETAPNISKKGYQEEVSWKYYSVIDDSLVTDNPTCNLYAIPEFTANTYTITFLNQYKEEIKDLEGNNVIANYTIENLNFIYPDIINRENEGYKYYVDFYNQEMVKITLDEDTCDNIYAVVYYELIEYIVTFEDGNGNVVAISKYTLDDKDITAIEPTSNGYKFIGWLYYQDSDLETTIEFNEFTIGNLVAKPNYELVEYTVTFVDENENEIKVVTYNAENMIIDKPEVPEKLGYLGNWKSYELNFENIVVRPNYYDTIKYYIYYYENGSLPLGSHKSYEYTIETVSTISQFTLNNTIIEWAFHILENDEYVGIDDPMEAIKKNTIIYAWPKAAHELKINYYADNDFTKKEIAITTVESGTLLDTLNEPNAPFINGKQFVKWIYVLNDEEVTDESYSIETNLCAYPVYENITYKVTYYDQYNKVVPDTTVTFTIESLTLENVPSVPAPIDGYENGVWVYYYVSNDSEVNVSNLGAIKNENLYAKPKYQLCDYVMFFYDEKGILISQQLFTVETDINTIVPPTVESKNGYNAVWNLPEIKTDNLYVQVEYQLIDYVISYYDVLGNLIDTLTYNINSSIIDNPVVPNKEYYDGYWNYYCCDSFDEANSSTEIAAITTGNLIAKPVYKPISYTALFIDEIGNLYYEIDYTILDNDIVLPNTDGISKDGYSCEWDYNGLTYSDMVIAPIYTPIAYTVDFIRDDATIKTVTYTVEDKSFDIPVLQEKVGYTYKWYYNELEFDKSLLTTGNIEVVEKETIITYTINFVDENNNFITSRIYTVEDKSFNIPVNVPQKQYYTVHWELNGVLFDELSKDELLEGITADLVINLVYEQIKYKITFKDDNGNIIDTLDKEYYYTVNEQKEISLLVQQGDLIESINSSNTPIIPDIPTYWNRSWNFDIKDLGVEYISTIENSNPRNFTIYFYNSKSDFENNIILDTDQFTIEDKSFVLPDENVTWVFFKEGETNTPIDIDVFFNNTDEIYNLHAYKENISSEYSYTIKYYDIDNKLIYNQIVEGAVLLENVTKLLVPNVVGLENGEWKFTYEGDGLPSNKGIVVAVPVYSNVLYNVTYYTLEDTIMETSNYVIHGENANIISNVPVIPAKVGYTAKWNYTLNGAMVLVNENAISGLAVPGDIEAKITYEPINYTITFKYGEETIGEANYSIVNPSFFKPTISHKDGYNRTWKYYDTETNSEIVLVNDMLPNGTYGNIIAKVFDTPIVYTIKYLDSFGKLIKTISYDIENNAIVDEPTNTIISGYTTVWKYYDAEDISIEVNEITFGNLIAKEVSTLIDYKVVFTDEADNIIYETTFNVENQSVINPDVPQKVGYNAKWDDVRFNYEDTTIVPIYTPITYTIVYHVGSTVQTLEYTICDKSNIVEPALSIVDGKQGVWIYYDVDNNAVELKNDTYGDLYAYADYSYDENENYVITFVDEFGNELYIKLLPSNLSINELVLPDVPSKQGYATKQWDLPDTEIVANTIIYPTYSDPIDYKVSLYDKNNEFVESFVYNIETIDDVIYLFKTYNISVTGYTQLDWTYYNENNLSQVINIDEIGKTFFGNVTAKYNDTPITYTIVFDPNTGEGEMESLNCIYDQSIKLQESLFTKVGYHQIGWLINDVHYVEEAEINENLSTQNGAIVYCKAEWEANTYVLRFITNTEESSYNDVTLKYDDEFTLPTPVKTGYKEGKWMYNGVSYEFGEPYKNFTSEYSADADKPVVELEAVWTPITYTIKFNTGTDSCSFDSIVLNYDDYLKDSTKQYLPNPTGQLSLHGYTPVLKWYNGNVEYEFDSLIKNLTATDGYVITFHINWSPVVFTISFNASDGSGAPNSISTNYDATITIPSTIPSKTGAYFRGWAEQYYLLTPGDNDKYTSGTKIKAKDLYDDGTLTLYACWEKLYTISGTHSSTDSSENRVYVTTKGVNGKEANAGGYYRATTEVSFKFTFNNGEEGNIKISNTSYDKDFTSETSDSFTMPYSDVKFSIEDDGSCIAKGSLITLADGTHKKVEDLLPSDLILVFNHETGKLEATTMLFNDYDSEFEYRIINLEFSDGTTVKVIYEHGFFDTTLGKYVYINESNMLDYIGHKFYKGNVGVSESVTLIKAYITEELTECYSPVTSYHLNFFVNDMLSIAAGIEGLFNIFEFDENLKYNEDKFNNDINEYGLFTYQDFAEYMPEEVFNALPAKYLKVSIGKGLISYEGILILIEKYMEEVLDFNYIEFII